jgi:hypothetical protein
VTPEGFKLVPKGRRKGIELGWKSIVSGDAALTAALNASLYKSRADAPALPGFKH